MSQPLDLTITLTLPPQGSPPEITASITLHCDALGFVHIGDLLHDPLTQQDRDDLHWYLEEYWKWPYLEFATRGKQVEALATSNQHCERTTAHPQLALGAAP